MLSGFPLLTEACKGRICPERLEPLLEVAHLLNEPLRAELREFMAGLHALLGPRQG
jgi:hypothetical protein